MKNELHFSQQARRDLEEIEAYIAAELQNEALARRMVGRILDAAARLEGFAGIGAPLPSIVDLDSDYRFLVVENYLLFYRVLNTDVYIDRILYGRRDYLRLLFPEGQTPQN